MGSGDGEVEPLQLGDSDEEVRRRGHEVRESPLRFFGRGVCGVLRGGGQDQRAEDQNQRQAREKSPGRGLRRVLLRSRRSPDRRHLRPATETHITRVSRLRTYRLRDVSRCGKSHL